MSEDLSGGFNPVAVHTMYHNADGSTMSAFDAASSEKGGVTPEATGLGLIKATI